MKTVQSLLVVFGLLLGGCDHLPDNSPQNDLKERFIFFKSAGLCFATYRGPNHSWGVQVPCSPDVLARAVDIDIYKPGKPRN